MNTDERDAAEAVAKMEAMRDTTLQESEESLELLQRVNASIDADIAAGRLHNPLEFMRSVVGEP